MFWLGAAGGWKMVFTARPGQAPGTAAVPAENAMRTQRSWRGDAASSGSGSQTSNGRLTAILLYADGRVAMVRCQEHEGFSSGG